MAGYAAASRADGDATKAVESLNKTSQNPDAIARSGDVQAAPASDRSASRPRGAVLSSCNSFPQTLESGSVVTKDQRGSAREAFMESTSPYRSGAIIASRYRLLRQLGRGGMGEVWAAHHLTLNTEVAVKFLSTGAGGNAAKIALERFRFEAQVSAHLGLKTSHVVAVHDAGRDAAGPYLVMEHVRGRTLRAELNRSGPLSLTDAATLLDQICGALSVAHGSGIVHRDLKPSNLLLLDQPDGSLYVKVADFGIAKALKSDLAVDRPEDTSDGWMLGSPAYMSPEQMGGGGVDARSDMWALGVIIYECLTGRLPFPGRSVAELIINMSVGRFDPPSNVRGALPSELDAWFVRALAKRKEQRFARVEDMAQAFRAAILVHPVRRLPGLARRLVGSVGLLAAVFTLRPAPSVALLTPLAPITGDRTEQIAQPLPTLPVVDRPLDRDLAAPPPARSIALPAPPLAGPVAASDPKRGRVPPAPPPARPTAIPPASIPAVPPPPTAATATPPHKGLTEVF
jgi:serine/threonine-protein kinase